MPVGPGAWQPVMATRVAAASVATARWRMEGMAVIGGG